MPSSRHGTTGEESRPSRSTSQWAAMAQKLCTTCTQLAVGIGGVNLGGKTPYSDVLWSNPVIGQGNTQGLNDQTHQVLPTLHNFTLDTYVYVTNLAVTQNLEFDINWYMGGVGMEWGTQCDHLGDGAWDIWDNVNAKWFSSGVPCQLNDGAWNHLVLQVQ